MQKNAGISKFFSAIITGLVAMINIATVKVWYSLPVSKSLTGTDQSYGEQKVSFVGESAILDFSNGEKHFSVGLNLLAAASKQSTSGGNSGIETIGVNDIPQSSWLPASFNQQIADQGEIQKTGITVAFVRELDLVVIKCDNNVVTSFSMSELISAYELHTKNAQQYQPSFSPATA